MSRMSTMARTIRKNGEMKRATWDPSNIVGLSGWPLRNYLWWREEKGYDGPENFCHFMRVAMIWAPLRWIGSLIGKYVFNRYVGAAIVILTLAWSVIISDDIVAMIQGALAGFSLMAGFVAACHYGPRLYTNEPGVKWLNERPRVIGLMLAVFGLPVFVVMMTVFGAFELLVRAWPTVKRANKWFLKAHPSSTSWLRPWVVVAALICALAPFSELALAVARGMAISLSFVAVIVGASWLTDRHEAAKKLAEEQALRDERELYFRFLFNIVHPEWMFDQAKFASWLTRYKAWFNDMTGEDIEKMTPDEIAWRRPWRAYSEHTEALDLYRMSFAPKKTRREKPVKVQKARRRIIPLAVVTFFQLVWAFVVTTKWKTCPLISIPTQQEA